MTQNNLQYSKEALAALYAMGYNLYENGKYSVAIDVFRVLTLFDKDERKHWIGLGASYQLLKDYDRALQSYAYAAILNENEPYAHFHAAECLLSQNKKEQGLQVLNIAKKIALHNKIKYNQLLLRIELIKNAHEEIGE